MAPRGTWLRDVGSLCLAVFVATSLLTAPVAQGNNDNPDPEPLGSKLTNSIGMKFVRIKAGKFMMGTTNDDKDASDEEKPRHEVTISKAFYLGVHEVTQKQYQAVTGKTPAYFRSTGDGMDKVRDFRDEDLGDFPVENVSWDDVQAFVEKLDALEAKKGFGRKYRLPTEAEWEYACRAGEKGYRPFHFGDTLARQQANHGQQHNRPVKVGSYPPNAWGLFDMHGNVYEWCSDWYNEGYYKNSPKVDPRGPGKGTYRVIRGGSWYAWNGSCRSAARNKYGPTVGYGGLGFRLVMERIR